PGRLAARQAHMPTRAAGRASSTHAHTRGPDPDGTDNAPPAVVAAPRRIRAARGGDLLRAAVADTGVRGPPGRVIRLVTVYAPAGRNRTLCPALAPTPAATCASSQCWCAF